MWRERLSACGFFDQLPAEEVALDEALGRVSAVSVYAAQSVPHYNSAAMDGIAVRAADTFRAQETAPVTLTLLSKEQPFSEGGC